MWRAHPGGGVSRGRLRAGAFVSAFPLDRRFGLDRRVRPLRRPAAPGDDPRRASYVERRDRTRRRRRWPGCDANPRASVVRLGPLLRAPFTLHPPEPCARASRAAPRRRGGRVDVGGARSSSAGSGGPPAAAADARHRRPRREPGRARPRDARCLRLRGHAARSLDPGRAGVHYRFFRRRGARLDVAPHPHGTSGLPPAAKSTAARCAPPGGRDGPGRAGVRRSLFTHLNLAGRRCGPGAAAASSW